MMKINNKIVFNTIAITFMVELFIVMLLPFQLSLEERQKRRLYEKAKMFKYMYEINFKENFGGRLVDINTYKDSYYYPYDSAAQMGDFESYPVNEINLEFNNIISVHYTITNVTRSGYTLTYYSPLYPKSDVNKNLLTNYTLKVSDKQDIIEKIWQKMIPKTKELYNTQKKGTWNDEVFPLKQDVKTPRLSRDLPTNKEELSIYLDWLCIIEGVSNPYELRDAYGTSIKFEVIKVGLKATSAGADKVFDTQDDEVFINEL